jgi:hypothetical protein
LTSFSICDARGDLGLRHAVLLEAEGDVLLDRHVREQRIGLEHHVDRPLVGRHAGQILPSSMISPACRLLETGEHAQQRGLAAAGGAEQGEELAVIDIQRQIVDGGEIAEALGDVLDRNKRLGGRIGPRRKRTANIAE